MLLELEKPNDEYGQPRLLLRIATLRSQLESRLDCFCDKNQRDEIVESATSSNFKESEFAPSIFNWPFLRMVLRKARRTGGS